MKTATKRRVAVWKSRGYVYPTWRRFGGKDYQFRQRWGPSRLYLDSFVRKLRQRGISVRIVHPLPRSWGVYVRG